MKLTNIKISLFLLTILFLTVFTAINSYSRNHEDIKYQPFTDERSINLYNEETGFGPYDQTNNRAFPDDDTGATDLNNPDPFLDDDQ
jgi:hypothetical protein